MIITLIILRTIVFFMAIILTFRDLLDVAKILTMKKGEAKISFSIFILWTLFYFLYQIEKIL